MKTNSRKDLISKSATVFAAHKTNTLFATSDGQFFILYDRAKLHANSKKVELTIYEIDRHEALSATPSESKTESKPKATKPKATKPKAKEVKADEAQKTSTDAVVQKSKKTGTENEK